SGHLGCAESGCRVGELPLQIRRILGRASDLLVTPGDLRSPHLRDGSIFGDLPGLHRVRYGVARDAANLVSALTSLKSILGLGERMAGLFHVGGVVALGVSKLCDLYSPPGLQKFHRRFGKIALGACRNLIRIIPARVAGEVYL